MFSISNKIWVEIFLNLLNISSFVETCVSSQLIKRKDCMDFYVKPSLRLKSLSSNDVINCGALCVKDINCGAINFHPATSLCIFLNPPRDFDCTSTEASPGALVYEKHECLHGSEYSEASKKCMCVNGFVGPRCERIMKDCVEGKVWNYVGIYSIHPTFADEPFDVECKSAKNVIQKREDGKEIFNRPWADYANGFGNMTTGDFWLGLKKLYTLMKNAVDQGHYSLVIIGQLNNGKSIKSVAQKVTLSNESTNYELNFENVLDNENNTLGNCIYFSNGQPFSTADKDNTASNNAQYFQSGWWFGSNPACNPNGVFTPLSPPGEGNKWSWNTDHGLKRFEIYIANKKTIF